MYSLSSTHAGGGLLWVSTEVATFIGLAPVFYLWMRSDEREGRRADARADRLALQQASGIVAVPVAAGVRPVDASGKGGITDWKEMQVNTWEAMFLAKGRRVPVTRAYTQASLDESRARSAAPAKGSPVGDEGDLLGQ